MKALLAAVLILMTVACGGTAGKTGQSPVAAVTSTASPAASVSPSAAPTASPSAASSPSPTPLATPTEPLLVIADYTYTAEQVRLVRLDAYDTAVVPGIYDGVVSGEVIVVDGLALEALNRSGSVRKLGTLAAQPSGGDVGVVAVKPDLSQWLYTVPDNNWTSRVHLGSPTGDRVVATIPSPDGNAFYQAYAWNASGAYFTRHATGLGGVGPFLEYDFPLARFDLATGRMTQVSPTCIALAVLDDGTMLCRGTDLEVRTPSGLRFSIQVVTATSGMNALYAHVHVSKDNVRVIVSRDGSTDPVVNFQMVVAGLTDSAAVPFGPLDYIPDTWLPDGRLVADHWCYFDSHGACNSALDGTYIFSADGSTHTLFYKLKSGTVVNSI